MRFLIKIIFMNICFLTNVYAQKEYELAFEKLTSLIKSDSPSNFKKAVFITEHTFDNRIEYDDFQNEIIFLLSIANSREKTDSLIYQGKDYQKIKKYAAIFRAIIDTTRLLLIGEKYVHTPFRYNFDDFFGEKKWENMFVTKLLATRKGNCHSMPYLYKILCDEMGVPCHLALAPNHIYVKHRSEKAGWYNTELTSASFPIDAWVMASGYVTLESIQNGIYMDALDDKKCIALCVPDLAKGFENKYPDNDGTFILKCCDLTLEHFPNCINALLLKAETKKKQFERQMKLRGITNPSVLRLQSDGKILWEEMRELYGKIYKLGYRTMPEKMYVDWLVSLKAEREKYANKQVTEINKN